MNFMRKIECILFTMVLLGCSLLYMRTGAVSTHTNVPLLLVDDDGGKEYEHFYKNALESGGFEYDIWNVYSQGRPTYELISEYKVVIWFTGDEYYDTLTNEDQITLKRYLDNKGSLFISGQDIGYELTSNGTISNFFYSSYLHAQFVSDNAYVTGILDIECNNSEPICAHAGFTDSIEINGGNGAANQISASSIKPIDGAVSLMKYNGTEDSCAIRFEGSYKVVYFSFGFEGISDEEHRNVLMERIVNYLGYDVPNAGIKIVSEGSMSGHPGEVVSHNVTIINIGTNSDVFELELVSSEHTFSWSFALVNASGNIPMQDTNGNGRIDTGEILPSGSFKLRVEVSIPTTASQDEESYISFTVYSNQTSLVRSSFTIHTTVAQQILLVDDDAGTLEHAIYAQMLADLSHTYDIWEVASQGSPTFQLLQNYEVVIWVCAGARSVTLTEKDQETISTYLDNGGKLFLEGENIAFELSSNGTIENRFLKQYLNSTFIGKSQSIYECRTIIGHDDNPISQYLPQLEVLPQGSRLSPIFPAKSIFSYDTISGDSACIQVDKGYKSIFLSTRYFEGPSPSSMKLLVFGRILAWLTSSEHFTFEGIEKTFCKPCSSVNFTLSLKNLAFTDVFEISYTSSSGWSNIIHAEKNGLIYPLSDTNGNGIVDTGSVGQNEIVNLTFEFTPSESAHPGDEDILTVSAISYSHMTEKKLSIKCSVPHKLLLVIDTIDANDGTKEKYQDVLTYLSTHLTNFDKIGYDIWETSSLGTPPSNVLYLYSIVIWTTGKVKNEYALSQPEVDVLTDFICKGGKLLLSGRSIASSQTKEGIESSPLLQMLGCNFSSYTNSENAFGNSDALGYGLEDDFSIPLFGPYEILTANPTATSFLEYELGGSAGVRNVNGNGRTIFVTCTPIEGNANFYAKVWFLERCIKWLDPSLDFSFGNHFSIGPEVVEYMTAGSVKKFNLTLTNFGENDIFDIYVNYEEGWNASIALLGMPLQDHDDDGEIDTGLVNSMSSVTLELTVTSKTDARACEKGVISIRANSSVYPSKSEIAEVNIRIPTRILLVDDDGGRAFEYSYKNALSMSGYEYDVHEIESEGKITQSTLDSHRIVIWFTSESYVETLTLQEQRLLGNYLDNGGRLLLSGQDILYELSSKGEVVNTYAANYLGVDYLSDRSQGKYIKGVSSDPITNGISARSFAGSYPEALKIVHAMPSALPILIYDNSYIAGVRYSNANFRTVFIGCMYFEGQDTNENKTALMDAIIRWLEPTSVGVTVKSEPLGLGKKGEFVTYTIEIRNMGDNTDTFEIYTEIDGSWDHTLTHALGGQIIDTDGDTVPDTGAIISKGSKSLSLNVFVPASAQPGDKSFFKITVRSSNNESCQGVYVIETRVPNTLLIVDDSTLESAPYASYYKEALEAGSWSYDFWQTCIDGTPPIRVISKYAGVVWFTGDEYSNTLTELERQVITNYVNKGGRILLSGQDIGYEIGTSEFYTDFLGAYYVTDAVSSKRLIGTADLSIPNSTYGNLLGLSFNIIGGDGANNQHYPSGIISAQSSFEILRYVSTPYAGGVAKIHTLNQIETGRSIYLSFGFEGISTSQDRALLMNKSMLWLLDVRPKLVGMVPFVQTYEDTPANGAFNPNFFFYDVSGSLSFYYTNSTNISVRIHGAGAVDIIPAPQWSGCEDIVITAVNRWGSWCSVNVSVMVISVNDAPMVMVETPNGHEVLSGIAYISWNMWDIDSAELLANIYVKRTTGNYQEIASGISTTNLAWDTRTVPNGEYIVKVVVYDGNLYAEDTSDFTFIVRNIENNHMPLISVVSPTQGEVLSGSSSFIQWLGSDEDGDHLTFTIEYKKGNGTWIKIADGITDVNLYQWDTTLLENGYDYMLCITASDGITKTSATSAKFAIKNSANNRAPTISFLSPNEKAKISGNFTISWLGSDPDGDALTFKLEISSDGVNWLEIAKISNGTYYKLDTSRFSDGRYIIQITADDGLKLSSAQRTVYIGNMVNVPPNARILEPEKNSILTGTCNIKWNVTDANNDNVFIRIEICAYGAEGENSWTLIASGWLGSGWLGTLANPLPFDTTTYANGLYSLRISANDSQALTKYVVEPVTIKNNRKPELYKGEITPITGNENTQFTFKVKYNDSDGDAPSYVKVIIDDEHILMRAAWAEENLDYHYGILYYVSVYLSKGKHSYYFVASDCNGGVVSLPSAEINVLSGEDANILLALSTFLIASALAMILFEGKKDSEE